MVKIQVCSNCGYSAYKKPEPTGRNKDLHYVMWCDLLHKEKPMGSRCENWRPFDKELFRTAMKHATRHKD